MSRTAILVGLCVCVLGAIIGLIVPLEQISRPGYQRDDRPLILPAGELPRRDAVIALLRDRRYDELDRIYGLTLAADQRSATDDLDRFDAFAYADPEVQAFLDGWVAGHETSPLPFIARGKYYSHLAYTVRGDRFRSETTPEQFQEMRRFLASAARDFQRAIEVGPPSVAAYEGLIDIAITDGGFDRAKAILDRALAATDNPLPLHFAFMRALAPQWGGSHGATLDYWDSLRRSGTLRNPDAYLDFIGVILKAEAACDAQDCKGAVAYYEEALGLQPTRKGLLGHARALAALERYKEALDVLAAGLQRNPDSPGHHELQAIILAAMGRYEEALAAIQIALKQDPYDPDPLMVSKELSDRLESTKRKAGDVAAAELYRQQANRDAERAMVYGAPRGDVQLAWARAILGSGGPREKAYAAFEEAIRLVPKDPDYILAYGNALEGEKDCRALQVYRRFEKLCKSGVDCSRYVSMDILTGTLNDHCDKSDAARRKRMLPETLAAMESCKTDYETTSPAAALARCIEKATAGDRAAAADLGLIYAAGYGVDFDAGNAVHWLEIAAERGHVTAKVALGNYIYEGVGTEQDSERGRRLIREAAEAGDVTAMFCLGLLYHRGSHDDQDFDESRRWLTKAADLGSNEAQKALQRLFP